MNDTVENKIDDQMWEFICWSCKWRGVAQELGTDETLYEYWHCPECKSVDVEQVGWHKGNRKLRNNEVC